MAGRSSARAGRRGEPRRRPRGRRARRRDPAATGGALPRGRLEQRGDAGRRPHEGRPVRRRRGRRRGGGRGRAGRRGAGRQLDDRGGLDAVRALLGPGRTGAMVGPSGVGKSSLANALAGETLAATREIRETTAAAGTRRRPASCTCCPAAACWSTPPACGSSALYDDEEGVATAYADVAALAAECRFRDCAHRTEPGCAVAAAIDDGRLDPARLHRVAQAAGRGPPPAAAGRRPCAGRGEGAAAHLPPLLAGPAQPAALTARSVVSLRARARDRLRCPGARPVRGSAVRPRGERARLRARQRRHPRGRRAAGGLRRRSRRGRRAWRELAADLVVIGPEVPLVAGAADAVRDAGIACFGPSEQAAQLEGSKSFAKHVMTAAGVPTARAWPVGGPAELETALDEVAAVATGAPTSSRTTGWPRARACSSPPDRAAAVAHGRAVLDGGRRGAHRGVPRRPRGVAVRRHRRDDGRAARPGPGPQAPRRRRRRAQHRRDGRLRAAAVGAARAGRRGAGHRAAADRRRDGPPRGAVRGLLYAGLALTSRGVRVVEFNARFGDPETQVVLPLLETPLAGLLHAAATGTLADHPPLRWRDGAAVTVVVASAGYPEAPRTGDPVTGADGEGVLHAGTALAADGSVVSAGGRVLAVDGRRRRPRRRPADRLRAGGGGPAGRGALAHRHRAGCRRGPDQ